MVAPRPVGVGAGHRLLPRLHGTAESFVLTPMQKGLLAESLVALDKGVNLVQVVWELDHVPDVDRFRAAWKDAVGAFDALRLAFAWPEAGGEPRQAVLDPVRLAFVRLDLPERSAAGQRERLERFLAEDRGAGFDLSSPPLMRVSLLVLGLSRAVCVWTIHHAMIDGGSYPAVLQRVLDGYAAPHGPAPGGVAHPQFRDFLRWLEGHDTEPGTRHFSGLLDGFEEPTPLPLQEGHGRTAQNRCSHVSLRLDPGASERLRAVARDTASTPNTLVQLAWAMLLSRHSGEEDVVFGATWGGRVETIEHASRVVGPLINTLPVRVRLGEASTVRGLVEDLRRQHLAIRPFQHTALGRIKAASALSGSAQLFHTIVVFERRKFNSRLREQDPRWQGHRLWTRTQTTLPLVLAAHFLDGALVLELDYDLGLFTEVAARRLLAEHGRLLTGLCQHVDDPPHRVPMLEETLQARLTTEEAAREVVPTGPSAIERILRRASRAPASTAVKEVAGAGITYEELGRRVQRLSVALRERGVGPGAFVGVLLPRSIDAVVSELAVHAAGGAFVPLDPADPRARLEFMVRDSGAKLVLVRRETRPLLPDARGIALDVDDPAVLQADAVAPAPCFPEPASPAYVIYTSGSTGEPKGVCVSHGALASHVAAVLEMFALGPQDRVLQFAALTFDAHLEEVMPTLAAGAALVLRTEAMAGSARGFFDAVAAEGLTVLDLPTAFWHLLVRAEHPRWPPCVRLVVVGGEPVSPEAHRRFRAADTGHIRWLNTYGPTEATITSTCYDDAEGDHGPELVPIGRPLPGVSHFVLDRHMCPAPVGQLHVGGAGLASGYLNRERLTRERFVEHPFRPGARLYATGDRVRRTEAGSYVYLGRLDNQVKVRGFRVELEEIEASLREHPAVGDAAVILSRRGAGAGSLVGFAVADEREVSPTQLREHLAADLPSYMVPSRVVVAPRLPTTPSGKIDRRALAELDVAETAAGEAPPPAGDPLLRELLRIWSLLLGRPLADTSASFFDLGGDSLLVVEMFLQVEARLGRSCDAPAFFRNPTVSNLATLLRTTADADWSAPLIRLAPGRPGTRPLFLAPAVSGRALDYVHLAEALGGETPVYALQDRGLRPSGGRYETLREAAADFVGLVREVQPRGPYAIAGFSAGGVVAMAIAEELRAAGETTDFVGLIDSGPPRAVPVPSPFGSPRRLVRLSRTVVGRFREILQRPSALSRLWARSRSAVRRGVARWKVLPVGYEPSFTDYFGGPDFKGSIEESERMQRFFEMVSRHRFRGIPIDVVLFRVRLDPFEGPHEPQLGWQRVTGGRIAVEYLPGDHSSVLTGAGCREWVPRLEAYLKRREPAAG